MSTFLSNSITGRSVAPEVQPGVCRFCGCTDEHGCVLGGGMAGSFAFTCWWVDRLHTFCSAPGCWERAKREGLLHS